MTRAPEPAGPAIARRGPQEPLADDRATVVLPPARPAPRAKPPEPPRPAVPEVPAIADLAAPGRPDVDAVLTPEAPPAHRWPRPSRRMRARADEMARVLSPAGRRPRRGLSSVPAAAAVMAAVAVGGVGIALGLDAQRTGQQVELPDIPQVPAEQAPIGAGPVGDAGTTPTARTSLLDTVDDGDAPRGETARRAAEPSAAAAPRATRAPATTARPRPTTSTRAGSPSSSTGTPRSTTTERPTTRADDPDEESPGNREATEGDRGLDDLAPGPEADEGDPTAD
ncbi:hypothetical protein ACQPX6_05235 [Actinomycetospora sp. CA-101289]|uniref:hypothetical protein n=1 Tax=Actinomycetospora sp. CA-101289 TaxID=3239893 RepID=UPI003D99E7C5